ncbi:pirin family protein [Candidatus Micrarchaeota archaeon]|nr:pirin family protein [Candidatus Micrarchaeota archaeon]
MTAKTIANTTRSISREKISRDVLEVVQSVNTFEGAGFPVRRPFPTNHFQNPDPFILLDEMGPVRYGAGEAKGAPDHPHRGFETVTYVLEGEMQHKDSHGHDGKLGSGDVQWMTAGAGVVHSEMPSEHMQKNGGRMHGFQLWVNLPKKSKMAKPRYQEFPGSRLPIAESVKKEVWARVIAGECMGKRAVIETHTPIMYLHFRLRPGAEFTQPVSNDFHVIAYVFEGSGTFGNNQQEVAGGQLAIFDSIGSEISFRNDGTKTMQLLLLGGKPLNEPVIQYGPFVMNTSEEIEQAFRDYQSGKMGAIRF